MIRACITGLAVRNVLKPVHFWGVAALLYAGFSYLLHLILFGHADLKALVAQQS